MLTIKEIKVIEGRYPANIVDEVNRLLKTGDWYVDDTNGVVSSEASQYETRFWVTLIKV